MALIGTFELINFESNIDIDTPWGSDNETFDPTDILEICCETFLEESTGVCPVDTGLLVSSISATTDGDGFIAIADTDYAQYVEYGTWKMEAQPYFEEPFYDACQIAIQNCLSLYTMIVMMTYGHTNRAIEETYQILVQEAYEEYRAEIEMILGSPGTSEEKGIEMGEAWAEYKARREELTAERDSYLASSFSQATSYTDSIDFSFEVEID